MYLIELDDEQSRIISTDLNESDYHIIFLSIKF